MCALSCMPETDAVTLLTWELIKKELWSVSGISAAASLE